ncbi:MAG: multidrug effflux MFS transporter [Alphaproteobacteria bacterium]|nr:multidrug effflux MFS transporter [Alphaproteobacteria bacterium]
MQTTRPNEFIALIAFLTALMAMSIDTMLPAVGLIANQLGAANPNDRQFIVLFFFLGMTFGQLIFGPLSDSFGRKPIIYIGLVLYAVGAFMCLVSTNYTMMIVGRMVQGFGGASPRVVSTAMVRDGAKGADMARIMSFVMSVFMLVPILAPSIGQLVLYVGSWRYIFAGFIVAAIIASLWLGLRQAETLAPENRHDFSPADLWASAKLVVNNRICLGYTLASGFIFSAFTCYLGTSQQIFAEQYGQGDKFALWFGGLAIAIALAMVFNGNYVKRLGMRMISKWAVRGFLVVWAMMLGASIVYAGHPPLIVLGLLLPWSFFCSGLTFGNINSLALEPMGHNAGMAAAISGFIASLMAVILGGVSGRFYDGTMYPISFAFLGFGALMWLAIEWAERGRTGEKSEA